MQQLFVFLYKSKEQYFGNMMLKFLSFLNKNKLEIRVYLMKH